MRMLIKDTYKLHSPDKAALKHHGFRRSHSMSDSDTDCYSIRFPVLQYHNHTTVDGEIIVDMNTGDVRINAYNHGTEYSYGAFYNQYNQSDPNKCTPIYEPIFRKINRAFKNEFHKLGIEKVG